VLGLREKVALRRAFAGRLPRAIFERHKRPFTTHYVSSIYRDGPTEALREALSRKAVERAGLFRYEAVDVLVRRVLDPALTRADQVALETPFALVATSQLWHQAFLERFRPEGPGA
jgi:asparagine synthetase B (glutamine-hydrolysing)